MYIVNEYKWLEYDLITFYDDYIFVVVLQCGFVKFDL